MNKFVLYKWEQFSLLDGEKYGFWTPEKLKDNPPGDDFVLELLIDIILW